MYMNNTILKLTLLLFLILLSPSTLFSYENNTQNNNREHNDNYSIDWIKGRIYSSLTIKVRTDYNFAADRLEKINAAREEAKINYYKILKNINIFKSISILDYIEKHPDKNRQLFSLIDSAQLYKLNYPSVDKIQLTYFIRIFGDSSLMNIVMSERDVFIEDLTGYMGYNYETNYTGVLIDSRGTYITTDENKLKIKPSFFVTVKDSDGNLVFNQYNVKPDIIKNQGMVRYSYDIFENHSDILGDNPIKIVASGVGDKKGSIIVISTEAAKRMLASQVTRDAIQNGKVVIVIDK